MTTSTGLGEFLRSRRALLSPRDLGLPDFGVRRVVGLRREEIAHLSGVSVDYYTRMEQGRVPHPSQTILDALAGALGLDGEEVMHLYRLAQNQSPRAYDPVMPTQRVRPMLQRLLNELTHVPALVMGRRMDVLAWNPAASALLGDYAAIDQADRNIARITFLDPASRTLYADWENCARENVAFLRMDAGRHPGDPELGRLIDDLSRHSEDFRRWWAEHPVRDKTTGVKRFRHPVVGDLDLSYETLRAADDPDQALITYAAEPGTASDDGLRMLLSWNAGLKSEL